MPSSTLQSPTVNGWLAGMDGSETLFNAITSLTHQALYTAGLKAKEKLGHPDQLLRVNTHDNVPLWPSVYTGVGVITNRVTPPHRDKGGCPQWYDLLVSSGTHSQATLDVVEIPTRFAY